MDQLLKGQNTVSYRIELFDSLPDGANPDAYAQFKNKAGKYIFLHHKKGEGEWREYGYVTSEKLFRIIGEYQWRKMNKEGKMEFTFDIKTKDNKVTRARIAKGY